MPNVSRESADESISMVGVDVRLTNFDGGYTVCFESHSSDQDLGPLFEGLPDGLLEPLTVGLESVYDNIIEHGTLPAPSDET